MMARNRHEVRVMDKVALRQNVRIGPTSFREEPHQENPPAEGYLCATVFATGYYSSG